MLRAPVGRRVSRHNLSRSGLTRLRRLAPVVSGRIEQGNFDDYRVVRIGEMPQVDVAIVQSDERPTGVGETAVPPLAPAIANALFALTGKRVRSQPFGQSDRG